MIINLSTCILSNVAIFIILLLLFIVGIISIYFFAKRKDAESIKVFCSDIKKYISYKKSDEVAPFLLTTDLNVTLHNCKNLGKLPMPPGYNIAIPLVSDIKTVGYFFYSTTKKTGLISFTGTFFFGQWEIDFQSYQIPAVKLNHYEKGINVHAGFYELYISIRGQLLDAMKRFAPTKVFISGHSLGGALATICGYDLQSYSPKIYTFAAPRSGNLKFSESDYLKHNTFRVFNTEDVVPDIPLAVFGKYLYQHVGTNVPFTDNLGTLAKNHIDAYKIHYDLS